MRHQQAFSLVELSIAMGVIAILASSIVPIAMRSVEMKAAEKTALEMSMIEQASQKYFAKHNLWPKDISTLQAEGYLNPNWTASNPWQIPYQITPDSGLTVTTTIPPPASQWVKLVASRLPQAIINNGTVSSMISSDQSSIPAGTIIPWASTSLPIEGGFLWCNGASIEIAKYPHLYQVIGNTYPGGDGVNTFALPDLRGRTIVGVDQMGGSAAATRITLWGSTPSKLGGTFGEEKHQLTIGELPRHHFTIPLENNTVSGPGNNAPYYIHDVATTTSVNTNDVGSDQAHNIVQPSMALGYIIKY